MGKNLAQIGPKSLSLRKRKKPETSAIAEVFLYVEGGREFTHRASFYMQKLSRMDAGFFSFARALRRAVGDHGAQRRNPTRRRVYSQRQPINKTGVQPNGLRFAKSLSIKVYGDHGAQRRNPPLSDKGQKTQGGQSTSLCFLGFFEECVFIAL